MMLALSPAAVPTMSLRRGCSSSLRRLSGSNHLFSTVEIGAEIPDNCPLLPVPPTPGRVSAPVFVTERQGMRVMQLNRPQSLNSLDLGNYLFTQLLALQIKPEDIRNEIDLTVLQLLIYLLL